MIIYSGISMYCVYVAQIFFKFSPSCRTGHDFIKKRKFGGMWAKTHEAPRPARRTKFELEISQITKLSRIMSNQSEANQIIEEIVDILESLGDSAPKMIESLTSVKNQLLADRDICYIKHCFNKHATKTFPCVYNAVMLYKEDVVNIDTMFIYAADIEQCGIFTIDNYLNFAKEISDSASFQLQQTPILSQIVLGNKPQKMVFTYAGNDPNTIGELARKYFGCDIFGLTTGNVHEFIVNDNVPYGTFQQIDCRFQAFCDYINPKIVQYLNRPYLHKKENITYFYKNILCKNTFEGLSEVSATYFYTHKPLINKIIDNNKPESSVESADEIAYHEPASNDKITDKNAKIIHISHDNFYNPHTDKAEKWIKSTPPIGLPTEEYYKYYGYSNSEPIDINEFNKLVADEYFIKYGRWCKAGIPTIDMSSNSAEQKKINWLEYISQYFGIKISRGGMLDRLHGIFTPEGKIQPLDSSAYIGSNKIDFEFDCFDYCIYSPKYARATNTHCVSHNYRIYKQSKTASPDCIVININECEYDRIFCKKENRADLLKWLQDTADKIFVEQ